VSPANWVASRIQHTSDALDRAFENGLTGHVIVERDGKWVRLADGTEAVEFVSCSYLGLEQHPVLVAAAHEALDRFGVHFSIARNRARPIYLGELEELLGRIYLGNMAVAFGTVSATHLGVLPLLGAGALPSYPVSAEGTTFLIERTAHASMQVIRGVLEQIGPVHRFDMTDPDSLSERLRQATEAGRSPIVLVDGVGSMGGLVDVVGLHEQISAAGGHLYVDDAHGTSIAGEHGAGYAFDAFGHRLPPGVMIVCSLSKAFGGIGACAVVPSPADGRVLVKFANPLVFGQSIPVPELAATVAAARLHLSGEVAVRQRLLWQKAEEFDRLTGGKLVNAGLRCPIRGAHFDSEDEALAVATRLREAGVLILPAFFPTVAKGTGLIRFALSTLHDQDQLELAATALEGNHQKAPRRRLETRYA
jgi:7-keto-8-aminopelargonate synthetase-like enzyme